ncbi:MAG TPA: SigE family RNA polymerase sigma factor [Rugosimonospora sp.]|nr:SigE family RNA polymerase sigma factor [Rugosimonospora sp.]
MSEDDEERRRFAEYFAARQAVVRRTAYLLCGDWHWAEDLTQLAFVRLAAGWRRIREPAAVDAFVRTCLVRAYLAESRRIWRRREQTVAEPPETASPDGADEVARHLAFAAALRRLPPRQRATLICRFYQEMDVATTAAAMGCSEGTVKSQTARGLATLRVALSDAGYGMTRLTVAGEKD